MLYRPYWYVRFVIVNYTRCQANYCHNVCHTNWLENSHLYVSLSFMTRSVLHRTHAHAYTHTHIDRHVYVHKSNDSHTRMLDDVSNSFVRRRRCCCKMRAVTCVNVSFVRQEKSNSLVKLNWSSYAPITTAGAGLIEMLYVRPVGWFDAPPSARLEWIKYESL